MQTLSHTTSGVIHMNSVTNVSLFRSLLRDIGINIKQSHQPGKQDVLLNSEIVHPPLKNTNTGVKRQ